MSQIQTTPAGERPAASRPPESVEAELRRQADVRPDAPFLTAPDDAVSYQEALERSGRLAAGLAAAGVGAGDLVALLMRNSVEMVLATLAVSRLGAASVPVNTDYKGELLRYVLRDSAARLVIVDQELVDRLDGIVGDVPVEHVVVRGDGDLPALPVTTSRFGEGTGEPPELARPARSSDLYMVLYTSGTTGPSKGVMISHGHCLSFAGDWVTAMEYTSDDVLYGPLPLFHGIGYMLGVLATLRVGAHMHLRPKFSASRFWDDVRATDATVAHVVFSVVPILLSAPPDPRDRDHRLRAAYIGPSKLSPAFEERFGAPVVEVYGQSETGIVTYGPLGGLPPGSCGRVHDERFELRLVDDHDEDVAVGEVGEIVVRPRLPHTMMLGYLNKPEATAETWRNLWHHSGDRARMDADGWLYFVDRAKDCIRRRGENISSYEIELIAGTHPEVEECAAIPVPSEIEEEEVKLCVVRVPGSRLEPADLRAFCQREMPRFMVPRFLEFYDALPKTPSQKVEKYRLRGEGREGITDATWDADRQGARG